MSARLKIIVTLVAAATIAATVPLMVSARSSRRVSPYRITGGGVVGVFSTDSTQFSEMRNPESDELEFSQAMRGKVTLTFSGTFEGAPVELRARFGRSNMSPGTAIFDPEGATRSFSYTFSDNLEPSCYGFEVDWRSPTGQPVTVHSADWMVWYKRATETRDGDPLLCR